MADEGFGRRLLRKALPGLGEAQTNYQGRPITGATPGQGVGGGFTRNLSDQFRQPEVQAHINNMFGEKGHVQTAQKFARAGMGHALLYTLGLKGVPDDEDVKRRGRDMNRTVRGRNPGHVEVTPDQPTPGQPLSRDDWLRQNRARARDDRLRNAWGAPAPSEEDLADEAWGEERSASARTGNRAFYKRTMGTPKRRPIDTSDIRRATP